MKKFSSEWGWRKFILSKRNLKWKNVNLEEEQHLLKILDEYSKLSYLHISKICLQFIQLLSYNTSYYFGIKLKAIL